MEKLCKGKFWVTTAPSFVRKDDIIRIDEVSKNNYYVIVQNNGKDKNGEPDITLKNVDFLFNNVVDKESNILEFKDI